MNHLRPYLCLLLLCVLHTLAVARGDGSLKFRTLTAGDGLPSSSVSSIAQDGDGFIWLATRNGLCRYDGHAMKCYRKVENQSSSLVHNIVSVLHNDSHNNMLWLTTEVQCGVSRFDAEHESFIHYDIDIDRSAGNKVSFLSCRNGDMLVAHSSGVDRYSAEQDRFEPYISGCGVITAIAQGRGSLFWISTREGILCYDSSQHQLLGESPYRGGSRHLMADNARGEVWYVTTSNQIYIYNTINRTTREITPPYQSEISALRRLSSGDVWVGTKDGIFILNEAAEWVASYNQLSEDGSSLSDNAVIAIYEDRDENVWLGTYFGGVNYYIHGSDNFRLYANGLSDKHLSGKAVRQIIELQDSSLLIATEDGGVNALSPSSGEITRFEELNRSFKINSKNVHTLLEDSDGYLWLGLLNEQMHIYRPEGDGYRELELHQEPCVTSRLMEDSWGSVWAAGSFGLKLYARDLSPRWRERSRVILNDKFITTIGEDRTGAIWAGARHEGLCRLSWNESRGEYEQQWIERFENLDIVYIYCDSAGRLWIATNSNGVKIIDSRGELLMEYMEDVIGSNAIKGIVEDQAGRIWFGTDQGLRSITGDGTISSYTISDGLPTNQFNYGAALQARDGRLYFGTTAGMVSFLPQSLAHQSESFNLQITDIYINGQREGVEPYSRLISSRSIKLDYKQARMVRVDYSALNYKYGSNTHYAIKLDGMNSEWQSMGSYNQVSFSNLRSGSYTLLIKAGPNGVDWDEAGMSSLSIKVRPSPWLSWVALLLYALIVGLILWGLYRHTKARLLLNMQLRREHNERLDLERMNRLKSNFFAYVSHDLRTPLTLVLSPLRRIIAQREIGQEDREKLKKIFNNASRMNYLIDELLTISKIEMQQMQITVQRGDVMHFINETAHLFDIVAEDRAIDLYINVESEPQMVWFSPSKLERILYNLLSNAFKYSAAGASVSLTARYENRADKRKVIITIEDSGRGIPESKLESIFDSYTQLKAGDECMGFGLGLSLTRSLVHIHKGSISLESEVGVGSRFTIEIDVTESSYQISQRSDEGLGERDYQHLNEIIEQSVKILPEGTAALEAHQSERPTLLIVDDNHDMNDYLYELFSEHYSLQRAYDGAQALERIEKQMPEAIICDVMMPKIDGVELVQRLKGELATCHIPIIMLTAKSGEDDITLGYKAGADGYIAKPFNAEHLELMLENIIKGRRNNFRRYQLHNELSLAEMMGNPRDERFMSELLELVNKNISNESFGIGDIIESMCMSRTLIHNKIKALTGLSTTYFIRGVRMKAAKTKLAEGLNVAEAAYGVGYSDPNYFTKCFKKEFNMTPSEYLASIK